MELPEFLLARIAEDEAAATRFIENWREAGFSLAELSADYGLYSSKEYTEIGSGLGRFLAECDAKRRIVERAQAMEYAGVVLDGTQMNGILADLALPYADHPDFREEWKP